ncbi:MAG: hypothetical protein A3H98_03505 [Bacteroidetes bacterium RIFCSPLOWO2_02_FULL_36_8]|nr:MAG: hypothetical protein A3H98_03505 [Bacteroidetes bacterium RIFCSPLOWO2_02_FULL_36_8]OFY69508.1 MAG: hypothetical protein A3G23_10750 [Bacteroidetes bacterium RIFCSPLOWO2_12_FULL_37_12]
MNYSILFFLTFFFFTSCIHDPEVNYQGYPPEIGKIFIERCATKGCHTTQSKSATAGLSLQSWEELFKGSRNGNSAVIPYRADLSFLTFFINTYNDLGPVIPPTMPLNQSPLNRQEVKTIMDWINSGAPANNGLISVTQRPEVTMYIINQGCGIVYIMDSQTGLTKRVIDCSDDPKTESPHYIELSPDGNYFYICFFPGTALKKFDAQTGAFIGSATLGPGAWSALQLSENGKIAFVTNWRESGEVAVVDVENMKLLLKYQGSGLLPYSHGLGMIGNYIYVTEQPGKILHKINVTDLMNPEFEEIQLTDSANVHEIHFNATGTEYALSCNGLNEIWFYNASNDSLLAKVSTGFSPEEPHYAGDYLFVSCPNDNKTIPGKTGIVTILNGKTHTFIKNIHTGWQPHGLVPDVHNGRMWVIHRNVTTGGPAPHHSSGCKGKNGYMTAIDLKTLELIPGLKPEISVDPYFGAITGHKH